MTTIFSTPDGPCIQTIIGVGSNTFTCREYPVHVARVRSVRHSVHAEGDCRVLPWFRQRDESGRFVRRDEQAARVEAA